MAAPTQTTKPRSLKEFRIRVYKNLLQENVEAIKNTTCESELKSYRHQVAKLAMSISAIEKEPETSTS